MAVASREEERGSGRVSQTENKPVQEGIVKVMAAAGGVGGLASQALLRRVQGAAQKCSPPPHLVAPVPSG